ncbi:glycosyltransferase [Patescibacteria group bacterium]|nr:glycosyltransferase [Patescibacteria group bacterium]MBU4015864.1 glycosyltransferase [Patescibacteria group bacterium]MBU4098659.1 glycosyltransferase [Patescibacteria group bacterium]
MRIAIVNSNYVSINKLTKKGTEIFDYILIRSLARQAKKNNLEITAFASGDSLLPVPIESIGYKSSMEDKDIGNEHHKSFEVALVSRAFSSPNRFDLYHVNIGNGDTALSFAQFVKKPIIVTMHGGLEEKYNEKYLSLFRNLKNIYYVSVSDAQRVPMPDLNYIATIYHGIDIKRIWKFDPIGGDTIVWAGRAIADKGIDTVIKVIKRVGKKAILYPMVKTESPGWIKRLEKNGKNVNSNIDIRCSRSRHELMSSFQQGKLFLFPIQWEEPFGLVMIEAMACGTPIVAYARGSVPEVVVDGETGFIVNPSNEDIRGNFIIKKTGIEGLCEAVDRIYAMSKDEYMVMRRKCRTHVEKNFTSEKMASNYINLYKKVLGQS